MKCSYNNSTENWSLDNIKNIKFSNTKMFLKFYGSWKKKKFSTHQIWVQIFNVFMCVFIFLYMNMLDYNRFSSCKNLIRIRDFYRLDDLCASRESFYSEELNLNFIPVSCFWKSNWSELLLKKNFLEQRSWGLQVGSWRSQGVTGVMRLKDSAPLIHHANNKLRNHPSLIKETMQKQLSAGVL